MNRKMTDYSAEEHNYAVALPCAPEDFSKFISGLLGKPQTITKAYSGSFEISRSDIENTYHLIDQRVQQQNEANLIQFTVRLVFDDNSTVLLNSLQDFKTYAEVRPLVVIQVHLSWSYLVKFQNSTLPEKQTIEFSFNTNGLGRMIDLFDSEDLSIRYLGSGYISFRISHTARTWGADIESLLSGHIKHTLLPEHKLRAFVRKHSGKISMIFASTFFTSSLIACFYSANKIGLRKIELLRPIIKDVNNIDLKLNTLLNMMASGFWGTFFFSVFVFTIFSLIVAIMLGTWAESTANTKQPSYILLTKKSEQYKKQADSKYRFKWFSFLASIATGIIAGIIANIIFTSYWGNTP